MSTVFCCAPVEPVVTLPPAGVDHPDDSREQPEQLLESNEYTYLLTLIEDQSWNAAYHFLDKGETKGGSIFSWNTTKPDPNLQSRTWVLCHDWLGNVKWRRLPLHSALMNAAPTLFVKKLIQLYPEGLRHADDEGNLPLHLSFKYGLADATIACLLKTFPEAVTIKNEQGKVPIDFASTGSAEIIRTCMAQTQLTAKKEEGRLFQALESEKKRLVDLLEQLDEIEEELVVLKGSKDTAGETTEETTEETKEKTTDETTDESTPTMAKTTEKRPSANTKKLLGFLRKKTENQQDERDDAQSSHLETSSLSRSVSSKPRLFSKR